MPYVVRPPANPVVRRSRRRSCVAEEGGDEGEADSCSIDEDGPACSPSDVEVDVDAGGAGANASDAAASDDWANRAETAPKKKAPARLTAIVDHVTNVCVFHAV